MEQFEDYRSLMFGIAYRMMGSVMEAEDAVQEAYLRYQATPPETIRNLRGFLSTVVTRICLDQLKSAQAQREQYYGPWLPEPVLTDDVMSETPAGKMLELESISMAFMLLLENLTPTERAVFLLREVFDYDYAEIAEIVQKSEAACRQLLSRARQHVHANRPRFESTDESHRQLVEQFMRTCEMGDLQGLTALLAEDVVLLSDGGGKAKAATRPVYGREPVAKFLIGIIRMGLGQVPPEGVIISVEDVNGQLALVVRDAQKTPIFIMILQMAGGQIYGVRSVLNPDKLRHWN